MSEYDVAIKIAGKLEGSFKAAILGAQQGLSGLGVSGEVGSLALKGVTAAAKAAAVGLAAAGTGIAAVGTYAVNVGKDFEAQMSTVAAISGATGSDFEALSQKAKEMGATTAFSATEAGQAMEYMAMAGWKTEDMLNGIEGIMNLAAASGEDLAAVSDIVTDALTAFGKGADYAGTFADQLAAASANANVNVEMLGESFKYAAPVAGALGFTTSETAEALSLMGNAGIKASQAGTSMRRILNSLTDAELSFATSTGTVTVATQNADGTMRNLSDILDDSRAAFAGMTDAQKAQAAEALVGKNAMSGFLALMNAAPADIDKVRNALENSAGAAAEMAAIRLDNLEGDITLLKSAAESFGISLYQNFQAPFRSVVQYAKNQIGVLQEALDSGGFEGLTNAIGTVLSNGIAMIADAAPEFVDKASDLLASFLDGINSNSGQIGGSIGKLIDSLAAAIVKLAPRLAVTGINLLIAIGGGIINNMGMLADAAKNAVSFLWQSIKNAFKSFGNFLGDDEVAPFKKILVIIGGLAAGFVIFDGIGGAIKGFVTNFKSAGKNMTGATKGFVKSGNQMSKVAKNILAVGAGLMMAAAGIWLITESAIALSEAGPGAVVALILLVGGLAALMVVATKLGPKLQQSSTGLLAFGGAVLMAGTGMAIMSYAAVQLAQAGPAAFAGIIILVGGIAALMAIAGAMGSKLATATPGLLAFGAAILLAGAGMYIMASAATMLASAGTTALVMFAAMTVALIAFMVVAALLGPTLITAGAGMLILGAGILVAAAGMYILAAAAVMLSNAGIGAIITLVALVAVILLFGVACGVLAPLLISGGAALLVFGAGLLVVSAAGLLAAVALMLVASTLPTFAEYGLQAAVGILAVGSSLIVLGAGALVAGAGLVVAAVGLTALGVAALVAMIPMAAIGAAFLSIGVAVAILAASGMVAAKALDELTSYGLGTMASMTALAAALAIPIAPMTALAAASAAMAVALIGAAAGSVGIAASLAVIAAASALALASFTAMTVTAKAGMTQMSAAIKTGMTGVATALTTSFALMVMVVRSSGSSMTSIAKSTASGIKSAFSRIDLYSSGVDMMRGLVNGMNSVKTRVKETAREIAETAANSVNNALKVQSPSRLMIETGKFTGEGLAIGMEKMTPIVQIAAEAMSAPVQDQSRQLSDINAPMENPRTGVFSDILSSDMGTTNNTTTQSATQTFNFNPTYVIEGNADQEVIQQANKLSQSEFERMMNEWTRKNGRTAFA